MTDEAAMPPPPAYPTFEEVEHSVYGFECDQWEEIPYPDGPDWFTDSERNRRNENANRYQKYGGTPTGWARYLELGFFGYEDCSEFEELWSNFDNNPLAVHKAIWYQFMYHLDREFEISEKLQNGRQTIATSTSHIMNPNRCKSILATLKEWKILKMRIPPWKTLAQETKTPMDGLMYLNAAGVEAKSPPKETEIATPTQTTELQINGTKHNDISVIWKTQQHSGQASNQRAP
ncbi:hypothetical protein MHU86_19504 [Fragilaria crotonensis]|nr:hypothetical protein MHU86_19504 [Fragilaria crotonensis]